MTTFVHTHVDVVPQPFECSHGEIETDVARATITCRLCGAAATLPRRWKPHAYKPTGKGNCAGCGLDRWAVLRG